MSKQEPPKKGSVKVQSAAAVAAKFPPAPVDFKSEIGNPRTTLELDSPNSIYSSPTGSPPATPPRTLTPIDKLNSPSATAQYKAGVVFFSASAEQKLQQDLVGILASDSNNKLEQLQKFFGAVINNQQFDLLLQLHSTIPDLLMRAVKYKDHKGDLFDFWAAVLEQKEYAPGKRYVAFVGALPLKRHIIGNLERHPFEMLIGHAWYNKILPKLEIVLSHMRRAKVALQDNKWSDAKRYLERAHLKGDAAIDVLLSANISEITAEMARRALQRLEQIWVLITQECREHLSKGAAVGDFNCLESLYRCDLVLLLEVRFLTRKQLTPAIIEMLLTAMYAPSEKDKDGKVVVDDKREKFKLMKLDRQFTELTLELMQRCFTRATEATEQHGALGYLMLSAVCTIITRFYNKQAVLQTEDRVLVNLDGAILDHKAIVQTTDNATRMALRSVMIANKLMQANKESYDVLITNAYRDQETFTWTCFFYEGMRTVDALIQNHESYFKDSKELSADWPALQQELETEVDHEVMRHLSMRGLLPSRTYTTFSQT